MGTIVISLIFLVAFYENNKQNDFFTTFSKEDVNNINIFEKKKRDKSEKRAEKGYEYVLLNDQQLEI